MLLVRKREEECKNTENKNAWNNNYTNLKYHEYIIYCTRRNLIDLKKILLKLLIPEKYKNNNLTLDFHEEFT